MTTAEKVPWPVRTGMLRVADLQVDLRYRQVVTPEQTIELPQRVFDVLLILLAQPHVLHSRTALFEQVWAGVVVEDANLSQSIWTLRKALGPTRKHWIRTVAKGGYVFEPPAPVEPVPIESIETGKLLGVTPSAPTSGDSAVEPHSAAATVDLLRVPGDSRVARDQSTEPLTETTFPTAAASRYRRPLIWLACASLAGIILVGGLLLFARPDVQSSQLPPIAPIAVALIEVGNSEDIDARWPATVLHAWLEWKLTGMPEVMLLTEAHLAADTADNAPNVVLLSAGKSAEDPDERFVRARFNGPEGSRQLEVRGGAAQMAQLVDELSRQILDELVPARSGDPWPRLTLNEQDSRDYASAYRAYSARNMSAAVTQLTALVKQAPQFGLAHLQLAMAQARLGQARDALNHMEQAQRLLVPAAGDVSRVMEAAALSVDPQRAKEAATAYGALSAQYPQRVSFRLEQAWHELRSGDPDTALATLAVAGWNHQPLGVRVQWLLTLAEIEGARMNIKGVRKHAEDAAELARAAGTGWEREVASATLLLAQVDAHQLGPEAALDRFEEAALLFSSAGAEIDALFARVSGELTMPPTGRSTQLDSLLAHARASGYRHLEVQLLRRVAFQQRAAGNLAEYRRRLEDALAIADSTGDSNAQEYLQVDLLNEDLMLGRFESANERIRLVRKGPVKGDTATWLDQFEGYLLSANGNYSAGLQALDQTINRRAREGQPPLPVDTQARLSCVRAELMLSQGHLQQARVQRDHCATAEQPYLHEYAVAVGAAINMLAGDVDAALPALHQRVEDIQSMPHAPNRWHAELWTAYLLARAGELDAAGTLFKSTHAALQGTGYEWLIADAEIGLAEVAVAGGHWAEATRRADAARERLPSAAWQQFHRLDQVGILVAFADSAYQEAQSRLLASHARAHEIGDVIAQLELHSLIDSMAPYFPPDDRGCDATERNALIANTGMRGSNLKWMSAALPMPDLRVATRGDTSGRIMQHHAP